MFPNVKMFAHGRAIPKGAILLWSGSIASIPGGWQLCNGTNGTPDLRDKFVVGAGGAYGVNDLGGAIAHKHGGSPAAHGHYIGAGSDIAAGGDYADSVGAVQGGGDVNNADALPPYRALCYIMKL